MAWFSFTGTNPTNPNHYTLEGSQPTCPGQDQICAVQAANNGSDKPVLSDSLKNEMIIALNDKVASANVLLRES